MGYADYFAEIVYATKPSAQLEVEFLVTIKEVATGRIVTMFKSEARPNDLQAPDTEWVSTSNGYQQQTTEYVATPRQVGQQLGYETMQHLSEVL